MHGSFSSFRSNSKALPAAHRKARRPQRDVSRMLAAAVSNGLESLEQRRLMAITPTVANPGGPYVVNEGSQIVLDASASTGDALSYKWDLNYDGGFTKTITGKKFTYKAVDNFPGGPRTIALRVTGADNHTDTVTTTLTINDVAPTVTLGGDSHVDEGTPYAITWSATDPGKDTISSWIVDWNDGSAPQTFAASATGASHAYADAGNYTIKVTAVDEDGSHGPATKSIVVDSVPPVVTATGAATVDEGSPYTVNFSATNDVVEQWIIDWGDDNIEVVNDADLTSAQHVYADNGDFVVTITALSTDGDSGEATVNVSVENVDPDAEIDGEPSTSVAEGTQLHQTLTVNDPGADTFSYAWSVKKGDQPYALPINVVTTASDFTWTPGDNGEFTVTVVVTDDDGGQVVKHSKKITVTNVAPTGTITGAPVNPIVEGTNVTLTANPSDAGADDTFGYAWTVKKNGADYALPGDVSIDLKTFTFAPGDNGTFVATCVITDDDGATYEVQSAAIVATNAAPTATIDGAPANADEGDEIELSADVVDAGRDDDHTYSWSVEKLGAGGSQGYAYDRSNNSASELNPHTLPDSYTLGFWIKPNAYMGNSQAIFAADSGPMAEGFFTLRLTSSRQLQFLSDFGSDLPTEQLNADEWNHVAVSMDFNTNTHQLFLNGVAIGSNSSVLTDKPNQFMLGSSYGNLPLDATFDEIGIWNGTLAQADVAEIVAGESAATPLAYFDFESITNDAGFDYADNTGSDVAVALKLMGGALSTGGRGAGPVGGPVVLPPGTTLDEQTFTFVPPDNGTYRVKLTVTDDDGATVSTQTNDIVVANVAPEATLAEGTPTTGTEGSALTLTSAATDAGSDDVASLTHLWSVKKDGVTYTLPNGVATNGASFTFTPTDDGEYVVTYTVTDKDGGTDTTTATVDVANADPEATINGAPPSNIDEGTAVNLSSNVTDAGAADTVFTYAWSVTKDDDEYTLPGGVVTNLSTFSFVPGDDGRYVVKLVATDKDGGEGEKTVTIDVDNANPTAEVVDEPVAPINEGTPVTLKVNATDVAADTLSYAWSVKKGNVAFELPSSVVTDAATFTFTPEDDGEYVATVVVSDEDGGSVTEHSATIVVQNQPPVVTVTAPSSGVEGTKVTASSTVVDGEDDTHTYQWSVEKQVGTGQGKLVLTNGTVFAATTEIGTSFTFASRVQIDNATFTSGVLARLAGGSGWGWELSLARNGSNFDLVMKSIDGQITPPQVYASIPESAFVDGQYADIVATVDAQAEDVRLYKDGVELTVLGGPLVQPNLGIVGTALFTYAGMDLTAELDSFAVYGSVLDANEVSALHQSQPVNATPVHQWLFEDGQGAGQAANTGSSGLPMSFISAAIAPGMTWQTVTLPVGVATNGETLEFVPTDNGIYRTKLVVTDNGNASTTAYSDPIAIANVNPTATITGVEAGDEGLAITLGTDASDVGTDDTLSYAWSVKKDGANYGTNGTSSSYTFTPNDDGSYVVTFTVTDDDGGTVTTTKTIAVSNLDPTLAITDAPTGPVNEGTAITLGSTAADVAADELTYAWSVTKGGETFELPGDAITDAEDFTFTPTDNGSYVVKLVVTDEDGGSVEKTQAITVVNVDPTGTITGAPGTSISEGTPVTLTANPSDAGADDTFTYAWTVKKGGQAYALPGEVSTDLKTFTFAPSDNGSYVATVVITDDDGGSVEVQSVAIVATNAAPTATVDGAPETAAEGDKIDVSADVLDAGKDDTHTYQWSVEKLGGTGGNVDGSAVFNGVATASAAAVTMPSGFAFLARLQLDPTTGVGQIFKMTSGTQMWTFNVQPNTAPGVATLFLRTLNSSDYSQNTVTATVSQSTLTDAPANVALSMDPLGIAPQITVNGVSLPMSGILPPLPSPAVVDISIGASFKGSIADAAIYSGYLPAQSIAEINAGTLTLPPVHHWSFDEQAGATLAADGGLFAMPLGTDAVFTNGPAWEAVTLPSGTKLDGSDFSFTPADNGEYRVKLVVTDDDGGTVTTYSDPIAVANVIPTATVSGATTGTEGSAVSLTGEATDPGAAEALAYAWSVKKDGVAYTLPNGVATNAAGFTFTPADNGEYVVSLVVTDKDGGESEAVTHTVTVSNAKPTASITATGPALEASPMAFTVAAADVGVLDTLTYAWSVKKNGQDYALANGVVTNGTGFTFTPSDNGDYVVSCVVTDKDGGTVTATKAVTIANVAPTGTISAAPIGAIEGGVASFSVAASDVAGDRDTISYGWSVERDGKAYALPGSVSVDKANFAFVPTDNGSYVVTVVVRDEDGGSVSIKSTAFSVANAAPTLTLTGGTNSAIRGQEVTFTGVVADAGVDDTHSYAWDFGNGVKLKGGTVRSHAYTVPGTYTVSMTATDKDGASVTKTQQVTVHVAATMADPLDAGNQALVIGGTAGADSVKLSAVSATRIKVNVDGVNLGTFTVTGNIYVYGGDGDDYLKTEQDIVRPVYAFGGNGRDTLIGGSGADVLLGEGGSDTLFGWAGNDVLIGGDGVDSISGEGGDDLVIAGTTAHDGDLAKLGAVSREWSRTDAGHPTRMARLRGTATAGLNGSTLLTAATVFSDTSIDKLSGGDNRDWFFATTTGSTSIRDTIADLANGNESVN